MPTIGLILASKRPQQLSGLFQNLRETVEVMDDVEVLVKIDEEDLETRQLVETEQASSPFRIKPLITPRGEGYYTLHHAYNALMDLAEPDTYFFNVINDELRFETPGWDRLIAARKHMFLDDLFYLRISGNRLRNYYSLYDCCWAPENYGFYTRKWVELVGGWSGDTFWGVDSWQQCISYFLGLVPTGDCPPEMIKLGIGRGHTRGIPIEGIELGCQEAMRNLSPEEQKQRNAAGLRGFERLNSHAAQENFLRMAQRINAHLWAAPQGIPGFTLKDDLRRKAVVVCDDTGHAVRRFRFRRSRLRVFVGNLLRKTDALRDRIRIDTKAWLLKHALVRRLLRNY